MGGGTKYVEEILDKLRTFIVTQVLKSFRIMYK
jgi:hypothetical protein